MIKSVAFYPEYIKNKDEIEKNLLLIKAGGIDAVRFGEFAWGVLEPAEGRFDFDVFDLAFDLLEKHGLKAVLCTPTACPPAWMCRKYPGILPKNAAGGVIGFGARQHRCYNSPETRGRAERVAAALAERYGKRPGLLAWQIDNELAAEHKYCYCETCLEKFHGFLRDKYGTVEELNRRWFASFWAQNFSSFDEAPFPRVVEAYLPMRPHPSLTYEFLRFSSESVADFSDFQASVIRRFSDAPITTNQDDFYYGDNVDWRRIYANLDFVAFDIYSDRPYELAFYYDLARSVKNKQFWQMEFGARSRVLLQALEMAEEKGCEGFGLFAFNPFPAGQEEGQSGLVDSLGRPGENYAVFRDYPAGSAENARANKPDSGKPKAALIYDFTSSWIYNVAEYHHWETGFPQAFSRLVYKDCLIHAVYRALFEAGYAAEVIADSGAFVSPLLLPMHIAYNEELAARLLEFMKNGGTVLTTGDLFRKNHDNAFLRELPAFFAELGLSGFPENGTEAAYGGGKIVFADRKADFEGWKKIITPYLRQ